MKKEMRSWSVCCMFFWAMILLTACANPKKYAKCYSSSDYLLDLQKNGDAYYYSMNHGTYTPYVGKWKTEGGQLKIEVSNEDETLPLYAELNKDSNGFVLESKLSGWDWTAKAFSEISREEMESKLQESDKVQLRWTAFSSENVLALTSDVKGMDCPLSDIESKNQDLAKNLLSELGNGAGSLAEVEERIKDKFVSESGKNGGSIMFSIGKGGLKIYLEKNPDINSLQ